MPVTQFSADGERLVLCDKEGCGIWDVATGEFVIALQCEEVSEVNSLAFSPDSSLVAVGGGWGILRVYCAKTGKLKHHLDYFGDDDKNK